MSLLLPPSMSDEISLARKVEASFASGLRDEGEDGLSSELACYFDIESETVKCGSRSNFKAMNSQLVRH
jgi:hypothetical protein